MVSVVIATYNGEKYIENQLESIFLQTRPVDEVIICDDGSSDATAEIVEKFIASRSLCNWHFSKNTENLGYSLNFFGCIEKASGDIIYLCDQDDVWYLTKNEYMTDIMEKDQSILMLSSGYDLIDKDGNIIKDKSVRNVVGENGGNQIPISVKEQIGCSIIRGCASCFRAEIKKYLPKERFDNLLVGHDWLISIISSALGKNIIVEKVLGQYRCHGENTSLSAVKDNKKLLQKRIAGLEESIFAHKYLLDLNFPKFNEKRKQILSQIAFEQKRKEYLENGGLFKFFGLLFLVKYYSKYYRSVFGGFRILVGDFLYRKRGKSK